jgi:hypothetical protein
MFERMTQDDLVLLLETITEQLEAATLANDSTAIHRLVSKELFIRRQLDNRRTPAKEQPKEIDGWNFEWRGDENTEERICPLCGRHVTSDGRQFAAHMAKKKAEELTRRKFKGIDELIDFLDWHGLKL